MNRTYKYRKVFYGNEKTPLLVTKNILQFEKVNIDRIIYPISISDTELIFNYNENCINILDYIIQKGKLDINEIINLTILIGNLLADINSNGYIVGSIDLEDICFDINRKENIKLRQTRPLFSLKNKLNDFDYYPGMIKISQINYGSYNNLSYRSDVQLLGRIFIKLVTNRNIDSYEELRYIAYNIRLFRRDIPVEMQRFIDKVTNIYPENMYENVLDAISDLKTIIRYINSKKKNSINDVITYSYISDAGRGKIEKELKRGIVKNINQDRCRVYEVDNKVFAFIADGVSNCTYGSGYNAAKFVEEVCEEVINAKLENINTKEDAFYLYKEIVEKSNTRILNYININYELIENNDIMSTTFLGALIIDNKLYIASIGDSRAYLINEFINSVLTIDDNLGNRMISENISWNGYKSIHKKSTLTNVIGNINGKIRFDFEEFEITNGDILVMCSDGLTNYIADIIDMNDDWKTQEKLTQTILEGINKNYNISRINFDLVDIANNNGGLDNISSILIQL